MITSGELNDMTNQWLLQTSPFHWHELYVAAVFESDRSRLPARLLEAELAIAARARELFLAPSNANCERRALDSSLQALQTLRSCSKRVACVAHEGTIWVDAEVVRNGASGDVA